VGVRAAMRNRPGGGVVWAAGAAQWGRGCGIDLAAAAGGAWPCGERGRGINRPGGSVVWSAGTQNHELALLKISMRVKVQIDANCSFDT
jgi:hypothetical protein